MREVLAGVLFLPVKWFVVGVTVAVILFLVIVGVTLGFIVEGAVRLRAASGGSK